jgi:hypothetical protein
LPSKITCGLWYATLEYLVLALIDDVDASAVMKAWKDDLGALTARTARADCAPARRA